MKQLVERGLNIVHATQRFVRDAKRGFTDADIADVRQILAGNILDQHIRSYQQFRAQLFSGFHQPPIKTFSIDQLSLVTPGDIQREVAEIQRIQKLSPEELREELVQDAKARAIRYGLVTN